MRNLSFCRRFKYDIISLKYSSIDIPVTGGHVGQFVAFGECVGIDGKVGIVGNVESPIQYCMFSITLCPTYNHFFVHSMDCLINT